MPRLPDRTQLGSVQIQTRQPVISGVNPLAEQAGARLGEAAATLGAVGMAEARDVRERKAAVDSAAAESKATIELIRAENELAQDDDFENMETKYRERVNKAHGEILSGVQDPERRGLLQQRFALDLERGVGRIQGAARAKEQDYGRASLNNLISLNRETALSTSDEAARAKLIGSTMDAVEAARTNGYLSDVEATAVRQKFTQDYAIGAASMLSPSDAVAKLSGDAKGTIFDYLPADTRYKLVEQAKTKMKQESALLRVGLSERVQDATAAYLEGLQFDNPPSRSEFLAAYPEDGDKRFSQFQKTQQLGGDIALLANASPEDRRAILDRSNPVDAVVGAGFAADKERFGVLVKAAQSIERQLAEDPAAYAIRYSEPAKKAFEALQSDPSATQDYARAVLAEQQRLGAQDVKLLPESHARAIVGQFNKAGGEDAAALVESLANEWGRHWPTVYKQLSKDLSPAALVIGSGVDPATAEILARNANVKTDDLKKGLESTAATDASRAVDDAFSDFQATLAAQGAESTNARINEQAKRLAYVYMGQGASASEAAERAYRSLVSDKYNLVGSYRVPVQYDAAAVADGAQAALENLDVSGFTAMAPSGLSPEFIEGRIRSALSRDGAWVTNEDETGLVLTLNGSVVTDAKGNRIERSFDDLIGEVATGDLERSRVIQDIRERR